MLLTSPRAPVKISDWQILRQLTRMIAGCCFLLLGAAPGLGLEAVTVQLKWKHQFQFAGYYAAIEQGFYRDAGFDVAVNEGGPGIDVADLVSSGAADFGVCTTNVLREWSQGRRMVVLATIFQRSAAVILIGRRAVISSASDLRGRTLMDAPGSDEIAAMLKREGIDYGSLSRIVHDGDPRGLLNYADAMVANVGSDPIVLEQLGYTYRTFAPSSYGIDVYGDNLCTSESRARKQPGRVAAFRAATLKGWAYAVENKESVVDLIISKYSKKKNREALLYEAESTSRLVGYDRQRIGEHTDARWQSIASTYRSLGLIPTDVVPDGMVWHPETRFLKLGLMLLFGAAGLALAAVLANRYRHRLRGSWSARFYPSFGQPRLSLIMTVLFIGLSIPVLIFILIYNYNKNSDSMVALLNDAVLKTSQAGVERSEHLIEVTESPLRMLAEIGAADPAFFRTEPSRDLLYRALISAPHIDAVYVSFEDGYHRVVTRIDEDRRRADPRIPPTANWHSSHIDAISFSMMRIRHRKFFDIWPNEVGRYNVGTDFDMRGLPGYQSAKLTKTLALTEPSINPDTGFPIISLRIPIYKGVEFLGCVSANVTVDVLSRFLERRRASTRSTSFIADRNTRKIIAFPDKQKSVRVDNGALKIATLADIDDPNVRAAHQEHMRVGTDNFVFRSPVTGEDFIAAFANFPDGFSQAWQVITLTPIDDFVGTLKATNRLMMVIIIVLTIIELFFIYFACRRLSRPVENVSLQLQAIESLQFDAPTVRPSSIREIARLESAATLLRTSLKSFSSFVPLDVVRQLIKSGIPLTLGVEPRFLTIFFSDLENFSSHSETLEPADLLSQISTYLEEVSGAISQEGGTVDKFIGDGVMAFWNAPLEQTDHVLRGCAGALRAARRMERVNEVWKAEGRPTIQIRIGLNCANVLIGNVGSSTRLSYTALGDGVNVAARLEGVNKLFGTIICISDSIYDQVHAEILARPIKRIQVKGRKTKFMIYELLALRDTQDPELCMRNDDAERSEMTWRASREFEAGNIAAAERAYGDILGKFPADPLASIMFQECKTIASVAPA